MVVQKPFCNNRLRHRSRVEKMGKFPHVTFLIWVHITKVGLQQFVHENVKFCTLKWMKT